MRRAFLSVALLLGCAGAPEPPRPPAPQPIAAEAKEPAPAPVTSSQAAPVIPAAPSSATPTAPEAPPRPPRKKGVCSVGVFLADECDDENGLYSLEGYVVAVHRCPPCPPRALCKPCDEDFFMLSDAREPGSNPTLLGSSNLRVTGRTGTPFAVGQRVKVKVVSGPVMFVGDPCCMPGPYVVHLAPREPR